jgi:hypothetical protein
MGPISVPSTSVPRLAYRPSVVVRFRPFFIVCLRPSRPYKRGGRVRSLMADLDLMGVYGVFRLVLGGELRLNVRDKASRSEKYEVEGKAYEEYVFRLALFAPLKVPNNPEVTQIRMRKCIIVWSLR